MERCPYLTAVLEDVEQGVDMDVPVALHDPERRLAIVGRRIAAGQARMKNRFFW